MIFAIFMVIASVILGVASAYNAYKENKDPLKLKEEKITWKLIKDSLYLSPIYMILRLLQGLLILAIWVVLTLACFYYNFPASVNQFVIPLYLTIILYVLYRYFITHVRIFSLRQTLKEGDSDE